MSTASPRGQALPDRNVVFHYPEQSKDKLYKQGGLPQVHKGHVKGKGKGRAIGTMDEIYTGYNENLTWHGTMLGEAQDKYAQSSSTNAKRLSKYYIRVYPL